VKTTAKLYYLLTKPGIIMGNLVTTTGGFLLAAQGRFDLWLFLATLFGLSCVIGAACVLNNYIDRHADQKMARTKERALAKGLISGPSAIAFAVFLGLLGFFLLACYTNLLVVLITVIGFLFYVVLYTVSKYRSIYGTVVGSVAGAVPPVIGYCAVNSQFDAGAFILFMIVVLWQMPHFYAIAMYQVKDYAAASIPVLPVKKGMHTTKIHMVVYIVAFLMAVAALTLYGYAGYVYLGVTGFLGLIWLSLCIQGLWSKKDKLWARKMFLFSLVVIMGFSIMISIPQ